MMNASNTTGCREGPAVHNAYYYSLEKTLVVVGGILSFPQRGKNKTDVLELHQSGRAKGALIIGHLFL
jgi:hypothetical protein